MTTIVASPVTSPDGYASVAEIKALLGIVGDDENAKLAVLADAMEATLNDILGVDTLLAEDYTDEVTLGHDAYYLRLKNFNVTAVTAIKTVSTGSDTALTGWAVRRIDGRTVYFDTAFVEKREYLVTYTAGLVTAPASIKLALAYMVGGAMGADEGKNEGIESYNIFGKSVSFRSPSDRDKFTEIVGKYARRFKKAEVFTI